MESDSGNRDDDAFAFSSSQLPNEVEHDVHGKDASKNGDPWYLRHLAGHQHHNTSWLFSTDREAPSCVSADLTTDGRQRLRRDVEKRDDLRRELEAFVDRLRKQPYDGDVLIEFPIDYDSIVERLFIENKNGYVSLRDWSGPRRYQDLPISRLAIDDEKDRKTIDGLRTIDELDRILQEKTVEEYLVQRQTLPTKARRNRLGSVSTAQKSLKRTLKCRRLENICRVFHLLVDRREHSYREWQD